jgi:endonuclease/exonuclease/phosphatase family metal-dependent hydrolase
VSDEWKARWRRGFRREAAPDAGSERLNRIRRLRALRTAGWSRERGHAPRHGGPAPAPATELLFASYNIHKAIGRDRRFDPDRIVAVLKEIDADVVALQEADQRFGTRAGLLELDKLRRETGLAPVRVHAGGPRHGWHGNVVLIREGKATATTQIVLPGLEPRGALIVDLSLPAGRVRVVAAHLGLLRRSRARQIESLIAAAGDGATQPIVMMGDFNEWRVGRRSSLRGLAASFGPMQAQVPSFPARFPMLALDRIVSYPQEIVVSVMLHDTPLARIASDHLPIKARIELHGAGLGEPAAQA